MGTEVLRPHDVIADRFRFPQTTSFNRRKKGNLTNLIVEKKPHNNNNNNAKKTSPRPDKKKPNTAVPRRKDDINNTNHILSSQVKKVTILRRGESLDSLNSAKQNNNKEIMKSPNRKPVDDLIMMPKQIRISGQPMGDTYAGSAFSMSPSPRSLPVPSFFNNKHMIMNEDSVTRDLRRLLRLE